MIRKRLVIENDDKSYKVVDCMRIHDDTGIPVLFDTFHHEIVNEGESILDALEKTRTTWDVNDGIPMVDYSHQNNGSKKGSLADKIDTGRFKKFLEASRPNDFDIMLEIKDKEKSALKAVSVASNDTRFRNQTNK